MRKTFPGYYRPTDGEFAELWSNCLFVLDANVLLNLYRYSRETSDEFLGILHRISDRLWVPHQAALEYQERRLDVVARQTKAYDDIRKMLSRTQEQLENQLQGFQRHPSIDVDKLLKKIVRTFRSIERELSKCRQEHPDLLENDYLRDAITQLLDGKVGLSYSQERLDEIYRIGEKRYKRKIPPGYEDERKDNDRKYGDLILWLQVIDHAKETKTSIILITDERKEDWWLKFEGGIIGPRPELVEEMLSKAGVSFYLYRTDPFMVQARNYLNQEVKQEAIDEVRDTSQRDKEYVEFSRVPALRTPLERLEALGPLLPSIAELYANPAYRRLMGEMEQRGEIARRLVEQEMSAGSAYERLMGEMEQRGEIARRFIEQEMSAGSAYERLMREVEQQDVIGWRRLVEQMQADQQMAAGRTQEEIIEGATGSGLQDANESSEHPGAGDE